MADIGDIRAKLVADITQWTANIDKAKADLRGIGPAASQAAGQASEGLRRLETGLAALVSVGTALRLTEAVIGRVRDRINELDNINKLAQRTGIAHAELSKFAFAANLADVELHDFILSINFFNRQISEAQDQSSKAAKLFRALGVDAKAGAEQGLLSLADAFQALPDGSTKAALSIDLFSRSGTRLIPFLNQGAAGIRAAGKDLADFGAVASPYAARAAEDLNDNLKRLGLSSDGLANAAAERLVPSLRDVSEHLVAAAKVDAQGRITALGATFDTVATGIRAAGDALVAFVETAGRLGTINTLQNPTLPAVDAILRRAGSAIAGSKAVGDLSAVLGFGAPAQGAAAPGGPSLFVGPPAPAAVRRHIDPDEIDRILNADKEAEKKAAEAALQRDAARAKGLEAVRTEELQFAKARGASEEELGKRQAALNEASLAAIRAQAAAEGEKHDQQATSLELTAQQLKNQQAVLTLTDAQRAGALAQADLDIQRVGIASHLADAQVTAAVQQGASRSELLALAQRQDELDRAGLATEQAKLQIQLDELNARRARLGVDAQLNAADEALAASLAVQIDGLKEFNAQLLAAPTHVGAINAQVATLGQTLKSSLDEAITGSILGTGGFGDIVERAAKGAAAKLAEPFINAGIDAATDFGKGLLSKVGLGGGTGTGAQLIGRGVDAQGLAIPSDAVSAGVSGTGAAAIQSRIGVGVDAQGLAVPSDAGAGASAGGGSALGGAGLIGGIAAIVLIAIDTTAKALKAADAEAHKFTLANQSLATNASVRAAAAKQLPILGTLFGGVSKGLLSNPYVANFFFPGSGFLTAPTPEHQVASSINQLFVGAGVARFQDQPFQKTGVIGRSLADILSASPNTAIAQTLKTKPALPGVRDETNSAQALGLSIFVGNNTRSTEFANTVINNAQAMGTTAKELKAQLLTLASAAGVDLAHAIVALNNELQLGTITEKQYKDAIVGVENILSTLPDAIDKTTVALAGFDKATGRIDLAKLSQLQQDALAVVGGTFKTLLETDIAGGDAADRAAAVGKAVGEAFVASAQAAILNKDLLGKFLTKGSTELTAAVDAYVAGDVAGATQLRNLAVKDILQGASDAQKFLGPYSGFIAQTQGLLNGGSTQAGAAVLSTVSGFGIPRFDTGGIMPGPLGVHSLAMVAGGEYVVPRSGFVPPMGGGSESGDAVGPQRNDLVDTVKGMRGDLREVVGVIGSALRSGQRVEVTVTLDGRDISRSIQLNKDNRRTGLSTPDAKIGVRS